MIDKKNIGVIILNYNDSDTTRKLCETIQGYDSIDHIAVVDNRSPDGSFAALQRLSDEKVDVLQSDKNGGYSYGNNFGAFYLMDHYHMDILLIANPDVEFTETFLIQVVRDMEKYQVQAASGYMKMPPHAIYPIMNKKINSCAREALECTLLLKKLFPFRGELVCPGMGVQYVQWLPGSLFAIDAHVYRSLGGLDDRVFLFYEEQILGKKFLKAGYRMAVDTDISYFHNHSVSIRKSMKRYEAVKRLFLSKYFFYTEYGEISMTEKLLLRVAIVYGLFMRKWLYRLL